MSQRPTGPACGNNPNYRMSNGDRQAVADFKAYLADRAALERVRAVLETEAVLGRSALEYRGLIASALMADEAQPTVPAAVGRRAADETRAGEPLPPSPRCAHCTHPKRDHDGRADHRAKFSPLVAGDPWCHACNAECDYAEQPAAEAQQDGAQS
ncbi:hypothetical protein ACH5A2_19670 [Streptomyces collinus]|uniref:hypothetical protein n=1 Tax=Streptomyces collinus TaxID=42684 RepID=UPI00378CE233